MGATGGGPQGGRVMRAPPPPPLCMPTQEHSGNGNSRRGSVRASSPGSGLSGLSGLASPAALSRSQSPGGAMAAAAAAAPEPSPTGSKRRVSFRLRPAPPAAAHSGADANAGQQSAECAATAAAATATTAAADVGSSRRMPLPLPPLPPSLSLSRKVGSRRQSSTTAVGDGGAAAVRPPSPSSPPAEVRRGFRRPPPLQKVPSSSVTPSSGPSPAGGARTPPPPPPPRARSAHRADSMRRGQQKPPGNQQRSQSSQLQPPEQPQKRHRSREPLRGQSPPALGAVGPSPRRFDSASLKTPGGGPAAIGGGGGHVRLLSPARSVRRKPGCVPTYSTVIKIFVSYTQVLSITRKVSLQWPAAVREFLAVTNSLSYSVSSFISLDCSLDHTSAVPVSVQRTVISLSVPLMLALLAWLLWTALYFRLKARKAVVPSYGRYMNTRFVITLIVITFYCYPGVTDMLLSIFSCPRLDTGGAATPYGAAARAVGTFWAEDYDLECFKGVHNFLAMALALPLVVVFSLGVPAASALFLWYNRERLENDPAFAAKYGFVFGEYRPQYFYWESIIMLRKLVMVVVIVYVGYIGVGVQVLVALGVLMLATVMQLLCRPFREPAMNDLERLSLYSTCSTLYLSLFLYVEGVSEAGRIVLSCMLLGGNSLVAAFFTYCLGREVRRHTIAEYDMDGDGRLSWAEWEVMVLTKLGENWFGHGVLGLARAVRAGVHLARRVLGRSVRSSARAVARVASGRPLFPQDSSRGSRGFGGDASLASTSRTSVLRRASTRSSTTTTTTTATVTSSGGASRARHSLLLHHQQPSPSAASARTAVIATAPSHSSSAGGGGGGGGSSSLRLSGLLPFRVSGLSGREQKPQPLAQPPAPQSGDSSQQQQPQPLLRTATPPPAASTGSVASGSGMSSRAASGRPGVPREPV